jgi:FAD/FMN-containing dehydrogenase
MVSKRFVSSLFAPLQENIEGDVDQTATARAQGSTDASFITISPEAVLYPKTKDDVRGILSFAKEYRLPVAVRGNGTSSSGGSLTEGLQINLSKYFVGVHRVDIKNNTATIFAGTTIRQAVERLEKVGVYCPLLSIDTYNKTLGGLIAENRTTHASLSHGDTRLWVQGVDILLDNGEEHHLEEGSPLSGRLFEIYSNLAPYLNQESGNIQASHNTQSQTTTGYNIWNRTVGMRQLLDIIVGSEGTLGIITSATIRVVPFVKHVYTLSCGVNTLEESVRAKKIYRDFAVDSLSMFDTRLLSLATLEEQRSLPELFKKTDAAFILSGTFIKKQEDLAHHAVKMCGEKLSGLSKNVFVEAGNTLIAEQESFLASTCINYATRSGELTCIRTLDSIAVPENMYLEFADELSALTTSYGYMHLLGSLGSLGHVSLLIFADISSRAGRTTLENFIHEACTCIQRYKGSLTGGNGDGIIRTPYMIISSDRHMLNVFTYIQRLFDPEQVFNSGKKTFITNAAITHFIRNTDNV